MIKQLTIHKAGIQDIDTLVQLSITTFRDAFGPANTKEDMDKYLAEEMSIEKLSAELNDKGNYFFMVSVHEKAVGYAKMLVADIPEELADTNPVEIERIYVLQAYHNKKIGAVLMDHCITFAVQDGYDILWLGVWEHNPKAIRFYERMGFELFGAHDFLLGNDMQTDVLMKKKLSGSDQITTTS